MSNLKTRLLTNGNSAWRITRLSDQRFIAVNGFGKRYSFCSQTEADNFWNYLEAKGYSLIKQGRSLGTLKRVEPEEAVAA